MNLKDPLYIFCISIFSFSCKQQNEKIPDDTAIRNLMLSYYESFSKNDLSTLVKYIHPGLFDYITKGDFIETIRSAFNNPDYSVQFIGNSIDSISPVIKKDSDKYALLYLKTTNRLSFGSLKDSISIDKFQKILSLSCKSLKEDLGYDYVSCNIINDVIELTIFDKSYAIYLSNKGKWFFLTKGEESREIVDKIIPNDVRLKLGY